MPVIMGSPANRDQKFSNDPTDRDCEREKSPRETKVNQM